MKEPRAVDQRTFHDMRRSIGGILFASHILVKGLAGPVTDEQMRSLDSIEAAARELSAIVDELDPDGGQTEQR